MKLYHYNTSCLDVLSSQVQRGLVKDNGDIWQYGKNLSFFIKELPINLPEVLNNKHKFWTKGAQIWCHVIDVSVFPTNITYRLMESPEKIKLLYKTQDWSSIEGDSELAALYRKQIFDMEKAQGYMGRSRNGLVRALNKFKDMDTVSYYKHMAALDILYPEDKLMDKYAACVPHVMVYPTTTIPIESSHLVTFK